MLCDMRISQFINQTPLVAVRLDLAVKNMRDVLRGILRYANERGPWTIRLLDAKVDARFLTSLERNDFCGFIGHIGSPRLLRQMARLGIPMFSVDEPPLTGAISCDNTAVAMAAADLFLSRRFRSFAYVGDASDSSWSRIRQKAFADAVRNAGFTLRSYRVKRPKAADSYVGDRERLAEWLGRLPPQTAILAANDARALQVLDACRTANKSIPRDISLLSSDNDEILCETSNPTLSSIQMTTNEAGYLAAQTLDSLMRGHDVEQPAIIHYRFSSIVERMSTADARIETDPLITKACAFLQLNHSSRFTMSDLAHELNASRRTLELRFRTVTGRSLHQALEDIRIGAACTALRNTKKTIGSSCIIVGDVAIVDGLFLSV